MVTRIPDLSEYYFDTKKRSFILKNQFTKKIKLIINCAILISSLFIVTPSQPNILNKSKSIFNMDMIIPNRDIALINYVSKFNSTDAQKIVITTLKWAEEFGLDPIELIAIQQVESNFNRYAISSSGALGLMQIMIKTHLDKLFEAKKRLGNPEMFSIDTNIFLGSLILKNCQTKYKIAEDIYKCYNGSLGMKTEYHKKVLTVRRAIEKEVEI